jgi:outer membrane lipoprotein-sorting protein
MLQRFSFMLIFFSLLYTGCQTTSTLNLRDYSVTSEQVQEIARTHHARIQSIQGEGQISVETPEIAQSGAFILTLRKPDSVLISLRGPFGIKVGSALLTRTDFAFYNSLQNQLITGSTNIENLDRILHVQMSFDDLLNIFSGGGFLDDDLRSPDQKRIEDNQYVFIYTSNNSTRRYWIDPKSLYIQKIEFLDLNGKLTLEQTFNDFETIGGITMPYAIRVTQPETQQMLTLNYYDVTVNVEQLQFTFTIPQNAERIRW